MIKSKFILQVATLMSGRATSQIISLLAVPVVARLFNPDDFGVMSVFLSVVLILSSVGGLRYFRAALIEKDDQSALKLCLISFITLVVGCLTIYIFLVLLKAIDIDVPIYSALGCWLWAVPIGVFFAGFAEILSTTNVRSRHFTSVSTAGIANSSVTAGIRILLGQMGSSVWGLMAGYFLGMLTQAYILIRKLGLLTKINFYNSINKKELYTLAIQYKDYPLYNMPTSLLTQLSQNLPVLMIGLMFDTEAAGFYAMADRLIRRPLSIINMPLQDVFMLRGAQLANSNKSILSPFIKVTLALFFLGLFPFIILVLYGEQLLGILLGKGWSKSGVYVEILAPWFFSTWVTICIRPVIAIYRMQGGWLIIQFISLLIRASVFVFAFIYSIDILKTLSIFTAVNVFIAVLLMLFALNAIYRNRQSIIKY